jgi:hypothetical protein
LVIVIDFTQSNAGAMHQKVVISNYQVVTNK